MILLREPLVRDVYTGGSRKGLGSKRSPKNAYLEKSRNWGKKVELKIQLHPSFGAGED